MSESNFEGKKKMELNGKPHLVIQIIMKVVSEETIEKHCLAFKVITQSRRAQAAVHEPK